VLIKVADVESVFETAATAVLLPGVILDAPLHENLMTMQHPVDRDEPVVVEGEIVEFLGGEVVRARGE
jgi:hypothetical protein